MNPDTCGRGDSIRIRMCVDAETFKSGKKSLRIHMYPDTCRRGLRPLQHVSEYFYIRNFFFPDTVSAHTHPANLAANPDIFESALQSGKNKSATNPITCGRVNLVFFSNLMT